MKPAKRFIVSSLLFIFAASFTNLAAQTKTNKATVVEGAEVQTGRASVNGLIGTDETGYYTLVYKKKVLFIEHTNRSMSVDKSVKIPKLKKDGQPLFFDFIRMVDGEIFAFYYSKDSRNNTIALYSQKLDKSTLNPSAETEKKITEVTYSNRRDFSRSARFSPFFAKGSPDNNKVMIYYMEPDKEDGPMQSEREYNVRILGSNLQSEWEKKIALKIAGSYQIDQIKLDDNGTLSFIVIEYQEKSDARESRRAGKPSYSYRMIRFSNNGNDKIDFPVQLKDKFITDLQIDNSPTGDIVVAGFYSEKGTFSIRGAFYIRLDGQNQSVKVQNMTEFETTFITQYFSEKEKKREKKKEEKGLEPELYAFRMDQLLLRADGGATMIAEQFYENTVCHTTTDANGRSTTTCTTYYTYNDILVISFNPDGSLNWKCKIPKRQTSTNDGGYYSSYAYATVNDKIYFVFNDNPKNLYLKGDEQPYPYVRNKEFAVVLVEVDGSGKTSRELLFTTERGDVILRPKVCEQTGAKEMFICSERSKIYQLARIEFK